MNGETIQVTILYGGGIWFQNGDELKRLGEMGILRARAPKSAHVRRASKKDAQSIVLNSLQRRGVRDLNHYRQIVGNPRSDGPLVRFAEGSTLLMERCPHPNEPEVSWYAVLDTAIGAALPFMENLRDRGRIGITEVDL